MMDPEIERRFLRLENEVKRLRTALEKKAAKGKVGPLEEIPFVCTDKKCDGVGHDMTNLGSTLPCYQDHVRERARQEREAEISERLRKKKIRQAVRQSPK